MKYADRGKPLGVAFRITDEDPSALETHGAPRNDEAITSICRVSAASCGIDNITR